MGTPGTHEHSQDDVSFKAVASKVDHAGSQVRTGAGSLTESGLSQLTQQNPAGAPFPLRMRFARFTGLHPAVVRNEGAPAPTRNDAVLRHFLGVPAPGIDRGARGVESAAVADDQSLPVVFHAAADERRHGIVLWGM